MISSTDYERFSAKDIVMVAALMFSSSVVISTTKDGHVTVANPSSSAVKIHCYL